jgi:uncharacterized protein (DUF1800 family)
MASLASLPQSPLGELRTKHLLRRTTYNVSKTRIDQLKTQTPQAIVAGLLNFSNNLNGLNSPEPLYYDSTSANANGVSFINGTANKNYLHLRALYGWYLDEAKQCQTMQVKLATFLHQIMITDIKNSNIWVQYGYDYIRLTLLYAKGSYKEFATKMTLDNNMLLYLDNRYNRRWNPNENYAREFIELFTITKGPQIAPGNYTNYTEYDIQQAAKVLTGYNYNWNRDPQYVDPDTGILRGYPVTSWHDMTDKTFSSAFGNTVITGASGATQEALKTDMLRELDDFVDMIFNQDETAKVLVRRLYRFFVRRKINQEIENDIITPLSVILKNNNFEISSVLEVLLVSQHFYDIDDATEGDEILGGKIKDPIELGLHTLNLLEVDTPDIHTNNFYHNEFWGKFFHNEYLKYTEFFLFKPTSVAGYKPVYQEPLYDKYWVTSSTIFYRYRFGKTLMDIRNRVTSSGFYTRINYDIVNFVQNSGYFSNPENATTLINEIIDLLLIRTPDVSRYNYFLDDLLLGDLSPINWMFTWQAFAAGGSDSEVRIVLERTFEGIIASPEYQIH